MNGLKEGMEYLVEESKPVFKEYEGRLFANKQMYPVHDKQPLAKPLRMSTLTSFMDYIKSQSDTMAPNMIIHIQNPTKVVLLSSLNGDREREMIAEAVPDVPDFEFGRYYGTETFTIKVMAGFYDVVDNPFTDKEKILKFVGTGQSGTVKSYGDDGVSQSVTIQKTTTSKAEDIVPNPVQLCPYRTFREIDQPCSSFIFRMQDRGDELTAALFDADGGAWQSIAVMDIKKYLVEQMKEWTDFLRAENIERKSEFTIIA